MIADPPAGVQPLYLLYTENGARLAYSGEDVTEARRICAELAAGSAGYLGGYQFVGKQRIEIRAFFAQPPSERFVQTRSRGELFDFGWRQTG